MRFRIIPYGALREAYRRTIGERGDPTARWIGKPCAVGSLYRPIPRLRMVKGGRS